MVDLTTHLGGLSLKNPVMASSSEFTMSEEGIRACLDAGAGAVVAKSINEMRAAADQLNIADYGFYDCALRSTPWGAPEGVTLFNRSGLAQTTVESWVAMLERTQRYAASRGAHVIGSITVASPEGARDLAKVMSEVVPAIEVNIGAPHGREASAVRQVTDAESVSEYVRLLRPVVDCPLIVKLPGQSSDIVGMARAAADHGADVVSLIGRLNGFIPNLDTFEPEQGSWGAVGGQWMLPISLYWVSKVRQALPDSVEVIGTNGARTGDDVLRFLLAGACAVEMATAVLQRGAVALEEAIAQLDAVTTARNLPDVRSLIGRSLAAASPYAELIPAAAPPRPWDIHL